MAYSTIGYKHTATSLVKIRSNLQKLNMSKSIKLLVTDIIANTTKEYASIISATKDLKVSKNTIRKYVLESKLYKDRYKFEASFKEISLDSNYPDHPRAKKIEVIDLKLKTVKEYLSISAAERDLGLPTANVSTYLKRNQKSPYKGRFIFRYI